MAKEIRIRGIDGNQRMLPAAGDNKALHVDIRDWDETNSSIQCVAGDFRPIAAFGSSTNGSPVYGAGLMGNIIATVGITPTDNILAGVIAKYDVTVAPSSTYPTAALVAEVGDGANATYAVCAVIGGDRTSTTLTAYYGVDRWNSIIGSVPTYGLDLKGPTAHDGYLAPAYGTADIQFSSGGLLYTTTDAITANSTTTTLAAGTLGKTTNSTGRASIFVSDGSKWQFLTNS